jgi:hypothetical protein
MPPENVQEVSYSGASLWCWALVLGVLAGVVSWAGEEASRDPRYQSIYVNPEPPSPEVFPGPLTARLMANARRKTGMIAYGLEGTVLALALGVAGGMARRSVKWAIAGGLTGLVVGGAVSVSVGRVVVLMFWRKFNSDPMADSVLLPILMRAGLLGPIGAAAGLALGVGLGGGARALRTTIGGLLGGVFAAVLFDFIIGPFILQADKTSQPLPGSMRSRLIARALAGLVIAAGAVLVSNLVMSRKKPKAKAPAPLA